MFNLVVKSNVAPRNLVCELGKTPNEVFNELQMDVSNSIVNVDGTIVRDLNKTFEELGCEAGGTHYLSSVVKQDGNNK